MSVPLPVGWAWVTPEDVATNTPYALAIGPFGSNLKVSDYTDGGVPLVFVRHIRSERFDGNGGPCVSPAKAKELEAHWVHGGDVLVTKMGEPPGDSALYPAHLQAAVITADCLKWSVDSRTGNAKFFMYALRTPAIRHHLQSITQGVAQRKISLGRFKTVRFPCPPLPEQGRIAEALDSCLSRLDAAVASLEAAQRKLKAYRSSVLKAAVEGRLVPTEAELARQEGRSYEPANVLLERILKDRRRRWEDADVAKMKAAGKTPNGGRWKAQYSAPATPDTSALPKLPEGWCWSTLDQLLTEPLANGKSVPDGPGFPVLRLTAIKAGRVDLDQRKTGDWADLDPRGYVLKRGDFLIVRGNGSIRLVGRSGLVTQDASNVAYPDTLIRARVDSNTVLPELLAYLWDGPPVRTHLEGRAKTTAGIYKVNQTDLAETPVPLPPLAEQPRILEEIDRLLSVSNATSEQVAHAFVRTQRLRQAVLTWAFAGKLVDHDSTDEPAETLLARIRIERAAAASVQPKQKRSRTLKAAS